MASQNDLKRRLQALLKRPENMSCCDCPERQPRWASLIVPPPGSPPGSLPMGAFMCLECSGSHRRLGVHIAFVRSVNLDQWKEREVLAMENGGNEKVNAIYEAHLNGVQKPSATASGPARERFIRDKYERRKFFDSEVLQKFYSGEMISSPMTGGVGEESNSKFKLGAIGNTSTFKIRAPSDAAKKRAESKSKQSQQGQDEGKRSTGFTPVVPHPEVVDLLDFGPVTEPAATPQFDVSAAMKQQQQEENNFANFSDPFAIEASNYGNSVEVTVKTESSTTIVNHISPARSSTSNANATQRKAKPGLSSDDIMKLFHQPPPPPPQTFAVNGIPTQNATPFMAQNLPMLGAMPPSNVINNDNNTVINPSLLLQHQQTTNSVGTMNSPSGEITLQQHFMMQQQLIMMQQQSMNMMKQMSLNSNNPVVPNNENLGVPLSGPVSVNSANHQQMPTWGNQHFAMGNSSNTVMGPLPPMGGTTNFSGGLNISQLNLMNRLQMGNMSMGSMAADQDQKDMQQVHPLNQYGSVFNM